MRYSDKEHAILVGQFSAGIDVTIKILDLDHDVEIPLINNICNESAIMSGVYLWNTKYIDSSKIDSYVNLLYEMKDSSGNVYYGKFIFGGYVDTKIDLTGITDKPTHDAILRLLNIINARI